MTLTLTRSLKVKCGSAIGLPKYDFLLMLNSNTGPNSSALRDIRLRNFGDFEFHFSRSLKVKCDGAIGLPMYGLLLMVNSNKWPNTALLRDITLQNMSDLEFDLSRYSNSIRLVHLNSHI